MTLDEFKQQNPAYKDVPDKELAEGLYRNVYSKSGITKDDFYNRIGLTQPEAPLGRAPAGFNRGLGKVKDAAFPALMSVVDAPVNIPVDVINAGLNLAGSDRQIPRADSEAVFMDLTAPLADTDAGRALIAADEALGKRWGDRPEPRGRLDQAIDYVSELTGAAIPFAAAPYAGAARGIPTATGAPSVLGSVWRDMQRAAMTKPLQTATVETAGAVGAGIGGAVATEVAPGNRYAEFGGQLLGALTPTAILTSPTIMGARLTKQLAQKARGYVSEGAQTARAEQKVRNTIGDMENLEPSIVASQKIERQVDDAAFREGTDARMNLSLAERTGAPSLSAAQKDMESRLSGGELDAEIARRQGNQDAISAFAREVAPKSTSDAESVAQAAGRRAKGVQDKIDAATTRAEMERYALAGKVPTVDLAERGRFLRDELDASRLAVRDRFNQRATVDGLDSVNLTLDFRKFQKHIDKAYAPKTYDNSLYRPKVLDEIIAYKAPDTSSIDPTVARAIEGEPISFQDVKGWRERLGTDLRVAQRSSNPVDRERASRLSQVMRDFDDMIVQAELTNASPETAAKWTSFRRDYKTQYIDKFRNPDMKDIRARDVDGFENMADEAVAAEIFKPGNVTTARRFKSAIQAADDDGAFTRSMEAVEAVALDSLNKAAVRNGTINERLLAAWKRQHQSVLEEFPFLKGQVDNIQRTNDALLARQAQLTSRRDAVQRSILERRLAAVNQGGKTPESLIDEALKNPGIAARLVSRLRGSPDAMRGLRVAVWEKIPLDDPAAALKYLASHQKSLEIIMSAEHLRNVRTIAQARAMASRVHPPAGTAADISPFSAIEDELGSTLPSLSASVRAIERGRSSISYELPARVIQWWRAQANKTADKVWQQALYDPEVARAIVTAQTNPDTATVQEKLRRMLWGQGVLLGSDAPKAYMPAGVIQQQ